MTASGALEAVDRILNRGGDRGEVLSAVVESLYARGFAWVALEPGPAAGERRPGPPLRAPVVRGGVRVGELLAQPREPSPADAPLLERVALLVSHLV